MVEEGSMLFLLSSNIYQLDISTDELWDISPYPLRSSKYPHTPDVDLSIQMREHPHVLTYILTSHKEFRYIYVCRPISLHLYFKDSTKGSRKKNSEEKRMAASIPHIPAVLPITSSSTCRPAVACSPFMFGAQGKPTPVGLEVSRGSSRKRSSTVVSAVGDVSADGTIYLIAGAIGVALVGTAFPIFFSRKDTCPECDGAGFVRKSGVTLRANAARKDQTQIVCARCDGLGKLGQVDK